MYGIYLEACSVNNDILHTEEILDENVKKLLAMNLTDVLIVKLALY